MEIIITALLIVLNGLFAMPEVALISARRSNLSARAKQGNRAAHEALRLAEDPDRFLSTGPIGAKDTSSHNLYNATSRFLLNELGYMPKTGEKLRWNCFRFEVVDMDGTRIDKVLASKIADEK